MTRDGEGRFRPRLSSDDVQLIRTLWAQQRFHLSRANALTIEKIAAKFDVAPTTVWDIARGKNWKRLPWPAEALELLARVPDGDVDRRLHNGT